MSSNNLLVAYDREIFQLQKVGGVSRSFSELAFQFQSHLEMGVTPAFTFSKCSNTHLAETLKLQNDQKPQARPFFQPKSGWSTAITLGPVRTAMSLWSGGGIPDIRADVFHATYYRPTYFERKVGRKLAITIHDFIPEKLGWTGVRNPHIGKRKLSNMADLIICVSNSTAQDLEEFYGIADERVVVVHHGCLINDIKSIEENHNPPSVLYVGHRRGYKNFSTLVVALGKLRRRKIKISLVVAGPILEKYEVDALNTTLGGEGWCAIVSPSDAELNDLYKGAMVHCVTSTMEGFGMTILESMARGTPVIATDIPVFREVGGFAAEYFTSGDTDTLASQISHFVELKNRNIASMKCLKHAQENSWEKSAMKLASAYQMVQRL